MEYKKIIPCLDVKDGRVVKGINFENLTDITDPAEAAEAYSLSGADELVLLDITATYENRSIFLDVVKSTAEKVGIPFTVGGGISSLSDIESVIEAGADKVCINTAAVVKPNLIADAAAKFGNERIVVAIDAKQREGFYSVVINGGHTDIKSDVINWARQSAEEGAGSLIITSIDKDGTKDGYDLELMKKITEVVKIPVIASGGAGSKEHFCELFKNTASAGALAASLFHYKEIEIRELKEYLKSNGINVRIG